jgi:hypothetical protein
MVRQKIVTRWVKDTPINRFARVASQEDVNTFGAHNDTMALHVSGGKLKP